MIQIRQGTFETNSSSVHELVIPKDCELHIPAKVYLTGGEYGWGPETTDDTINYIYQACLDRGQDEVNKFISQTKDIEYLLSLYESQIKNMKPNMQAIIEYKNTLITLREREKDLINTIEKLLKGE